MAGRKQKPYQASWGEIIPGLAHDTSGRWRIVATGYRFTEADERKAVARYRQWQLEQNQAKDIQLTIGNTTDLAEADDLIQKASKRRVVIRIPRDPTQGVTVSTGVDELAFWTRVKFELATRPEHFEKMIGAPGLARAAREKLAKPPVKIDDIRQAYKEHSPATDKAKREALAPFDRLIQFTGAKKLEDLTEAALSKWRNQIVNDSGLKSSGTVAAMFSRVRNVLRLAARGAVDATQIEAAISRCKAKLYPPPNNVQDDPKPISRADFHALLDAVTQTNTPDMWRAMLLVGLNCALYMEDICDLQWSMIDLDRGTFLARRKKRGKCIRAAVLWEETIAALRIIHDRKNGSPFVFVSAHGTRFNKNTKINDFKDLTIKAKTTE